MYSIALPYLTSWSEMFSFFPSSFLWWLATIYEGLLAIELVEQIQFLWEKSDSVILKFADSILLLIVLFFK